MIGKPTMNMEGSGLISTVTDSSAAMQIIGSTGCTVQRFQGGSSGKYRPPLVCKYCQKPGHKVENCYKLQRVKKIATKS